MSEQNTTEYDINLNKALEIVFEGTYQQGEVSSISVSSINSGAVQTAWKFGPNGQIIVNDGTNDRVLIGKID